MQIIVHFINFYDMTDWTFHTFFRNLILKRVIMANFTCQVLGCVSQNLLSDTISNQYHKLQREITLFFPLLPYEQKF